MILSPDDIKRIVSQPSELKPSASDDDYLMEKFQRVAIEAVVAEMVRRGVCPQESFAGYDCIRSRDCRACWLACLEGEGK